MRALALLAAAVCCWAAAGTLAASDSPPHRSNARINGAVEAYEVITKQVLTDHITTTNLYVNGDLKAKKAIVERMRAQVLDTSIITSSSGILTIQGNLRMVGRTMAANVFLAENVVIGGVPQWKLVRHEHFEDGAAGWSLLETSSCSSGRDSFLGGHCKIAHGAVTKRFENLPPHSQVRLAARYHFIDNWQGETAFLKLGEHYAWVEHSHPNPTHMGIEMCGSDRYPERRMSVPVDVTQTHSASFLEVSFGSHGFKGASEDPCERSFGVDDVMLYVR